MSCVMFSSVCHSFSSVQFAHTQQTKLRSVRRFSCPPCFSNGSGRAISIASAAGSPAAHLRGHENAKILKYAGLLPRVQAVRDRSGWRRLGNIRWRAQIDSEGRFQRGHPAPALGVLRLGGPDAPPHRCRHGADNRVDSNPRTGETRRAVEGWRPGRP